MPLEEIAKSEYLWFFGGIVILLIEFALPTFIFFFFGIAAMVVGLLNYFIPDMSTTIQWSIFLVLSILLILILRKRFKEVFYGESNEDKFPAIKEYAGKEAIVKTKITPTKSGKVEFRGSLWTAYSEEDLAIGTVVRIVRKDNIIFDVESISTAKKNTDSNNED